VPGFVKSHAGAAAAAEALRRATALSAAGVHTPAARPGRNGREIVFDRIDGPAGRGLLDAGLTALLQPLTALHRARIEGLAPYDPFLRIRPRLPLATLVPAADILSETVPRGSATLHGDLHVGQFLRDGAGKVWIVDLDDLALGPPEADLANFAAHLATSTEGGGIARRADEVRDAWRRLGLGFRADVFVRYLRVALVRRHLKLRAAGRPDHEAEVLRYLRESSNFSIR
jgi:hypothetical protein